MKSSRALTTCTLGQNRLIFYVLLEGGLVAACATYKQGRSPTELNNAPPLSSYARHFAYTCTLSTQEYKWVPGRTVKACVFEQFCAPEMATALYDPRGVEMAYE